VKAATNFSYKKAVQKTLKQKLENCTPEVEDLFKRIFEVDNRKRITFSDIRKHPIFAHHFP
jgi:serine/threonine protein kinase